MYYYFNVRITLPDKSRINEEFLTLSTGEDDGNIRSILINTSFRFFSPVIYVFIITHGFDLIFT